MAKYEITRKGVFNPEGKEVKIGTIINIDGDDLPKVFVNKVRLVGKPPEGAVSITNVDNMKVDDLKEALDERDVEYASDDKSADLKLLLKAALEAEDDE